MQAIFITLLLCLGSSSFTFANTFYRYASSEWVPWEDSGSDSELTLVIHGQNVDDLERIGLHINSLQTMEAVAKTLSLLGHEVIGYNYDYSRDFTQVALDLKKKIKSHNLSIKNIYAHSMGGMVARQLIERLGFRPQTLIMFGSPHGGVPVTENMELLLDASTVFLALMGGPQTIALMNYLVNSKNLLSSSKAIEALDAGGRIDQTLTTQYVVVQGTNEETKVPLFLAFDSLIYKAQNKENHDGIAEVYSEKILRWMLPAPNLMIINLPYDHRDLISSKGVLDALSEVRKQHTSPVVASKTSSTRRKTL